jgi:hypothetical protein
MPSNYLFKRASQPLRYLLFSLLSSSLPPSLPLSLSPLSPLSSLSLSLSLSSLHLVSTISYLLIRERLKWSERRNQKRSCTNCWTTSWATRTAFPKILIVSFSFFSPLSFSFSFPFPLPFPFLFLSSSFSFPFPFPLPFPFLLSFSLERLRITRFSVFFFFTSTKNGPKFGLEITPSAVALSCVSSLSVGNKA